MSSTPKEAVLARIRDEQAHWHALLAEVGEERMEWPGPMGNWTFKDLVAHLSGWRERTIRRLEAAGRGQPEPAAPWPAHLPSDDEINEWIYEQNRHRPLRDVLADAEAQFDRLAAAVRALPDADVTAPRRFTWLEGLALAEADLFAHLHEEHDPSIRAWLARLETSGTRTAG